MRKEGSGTSQARERLDKINELWQTIIDEEKTKKKIIAEFCLRYGLRRRTVMEYLKLLIDAEKIYEEEGILINYGKRKKAGV